MDHRMYYICKYTPLELAAGFGIEMRPLTSVPMRSSCGECVHPNLCAYGKGLLERALTGEVEALFLVDCCDVVRRIYDVLAAKEDGMFLYLMHLPHKDGVREQEIFEKELRKAAEAFAAWTGRTFDEEKARIARRQGIEENPDFDEEALVLTGAHGGTELAEEIELVTGFPVRDETCAGFRRLGEDCGGDFFRAYAAALLRQRRPCMRMQFQDAPTKARGTICHTMKFCDFYGFRYRALREESGPLLKIETDGTGESAGQRKTRLEAFRELLTRDRDERKPSRKGYVCGIDSGSATCAVVILDEAKRIVASAVVPTGARVRESADAALAQALERAGLSKDDLVATVTTGYGRNHLAHSDSAITEISCHARGAAKLDPGVRTVIDIGGQDSKVIVLDAYGKPARFVMNDQCAAGTGRFLETMAKVLRLDLDEMGAMPFDPQKAVTISSMCTVFAESEVVTRIAENTDVDAIVSGLDLSVASKTVSLVRRARGEGPYMMTGGVARNRGIVDALGEALGEKIRVPAEAQICGALGAALFAAENEY